MDKISSNQSPPTIETHLAVAAPGNPNEVKIGTPKYMLLSGFAGGIVSGGSHFLVTPLDVVHVRIQSHSPRFSKFFAAFRTTISEEGFRGLARGWAPNLIGYSLQGFAKFGLYETLKKEYSAAIGEEFAAKHKTAIYLLAGASAETAGTLLLAPFESVKIRVQTCAEIPPAFRRALPYIYQAEGINGLFKGLVPLLLRQIPYTASKFVCFETSREIIYKQVLMVDPITLNPSEKMAVTITAGIIAGMCCEVISHPADVIVTQLYESPTTTFKSVVKSMDFKGLWVGTGARMVLIGVITGIQLFLIDTVRSSFNLEKGKPLERKICQY
uniref:Uncharacterized protein n=1 Tax=Panagrolaimus sp. PS1159 TaxID=55785 RepID=A0AC35EUV5_9BILA